MFPRDKDIEELNDRKRENNPVIGELMFNYATPKRRVFLHHIFFLSMDNRRDLNSSPRQKPYASTKYFIRVVLRPNPTASTDIEQSRSKFDQRRKGFTWSERYI